FRGEPILEGRDLPRAERSVPVPEGRIDLEPEIPQARRIEARERAVGIEGHVPPHGQVVPIRRAVRGGRRVLFLRRGLQCHVQEGGRPGDRDGLTRRAVSVRVEDEGVCFVGRRLGLVVVGGSAYGGG